MNPSNKKIIRDFLVEGLDDCIGLYELTNHFENYSFLEKRKILLLELVHEMLGSGFFSMGEWDGGFVSWNFDESRSIEKMLKLWDWNYRQSQDAEMTIFFGLTPLGIKVAESLVSNNENDLI